MKNYLLLISLILFSYVSQATTYYVSTTGSDNNPGTILQPFKTWDKLTGILVAGDIAYIRGGTYYTTKGASASRHVNWENMIGQSNNYITIQNYPGESPIFDCSNIGIPTSAYPWIVYMTNCPYVKVKGLHVRNLDQIRGDQGFSRGWLTDNSPGAILEQIEVDHIGGAGFILQGSDNVQYINCDSHHQADPYSGGSAGAYGGGDGFDCVGGDNSTNTTYTGCRAWLCSDDGWDNFKTDGVRTWNNCWSFLNGYTETSPGVITATGDGNGFKLGPANPDVSSNDRNTILRFMNNCLAFNNSAHGWDQNGAPTMRYQIYNCTSYKNGGIGFDFGYQTIYPGLTSTFKNNVAFQNGSYPFRYCAANTSNTNNTWTGGNSNGNSVCGWTSGMTVTNADFLSVSTLGTDGARQSNGSLPNLNFLKLAATSGLINKGVNVGLPYISSAPDLGAFESNGSSSNVIPTANAGADQTITLPTSTVNLIGSGIDPDGSISAYLWTKTSGPTNGTITNTNTATTSITGLSQGVYQFELKVTDNSGATGTDILQVIVNAAVANTVPTANAGTDQTLTAPTNSVSLAGTGNDPGGSIVSYLWTKVSGPTTGTISVSNTATTNVSGLIVGVYQFELKVTDNAAATGKDTIKVTINAASNQVPVANAGLDKIVVLPTSTVSLAGNGTDPDGTIISYAWSKVSGPAAGTITTPAAAATTVTSLAQGIYKLELKVTDNIGAIAKDTIQVTVNAAGNQLPIANAGLDKIVELPTSTVSLAGSGTDTDGTISSYAWSKISGPSGGTIVTSTAATTAITGLTQGVYKYELKVSDNAAATGKDTVQITVNAASAANNAYGGVRWAIPGTIQAENYDVGGQNVGYYDNSTGNSGGSYRSPDEVDIVPCNEGGYFVGWSLPGEWMKYSVNVTSSGTYTLKARIACTESGKSFRIEMDGIIIATVLPPVTGGIQNWLTVSIPNINLTAGNKIMKIYWITGWGVNINYVKFTATSVLGLRSNSSDSTNLEEAETTVTTFPLPFSTSFTVNLFGKTNGIYNLTLIDLTGNAVWKKEVTKNSESYNETLYMGNLLDGVYILEVIAPDQKKSAHKIIKN